MYQVKVLSDSDFEALPYPDMEVSLGVADPKTNTAYVRYTGLGELDKYLVNHELEHLIEGSGGEHSDHYENGLYYKKPNNFFSSIIPMVTSLIPGIGPIAGPASAAIIQSRNSKKSNSQAMAGSSSGMESSGSAVGSSPLESFLPEKPNVVSTNSSTSLGGGNSISSFQGGRTPVERVRGFFSSRNPQGGF